MSTLFWVSYVFLWLLLIIVSIVLLSVLRNLGVIYESLGNTKSKGSALDQKLPAGQQLPDISLEQFNGTKTSLLDHIDDKLAISIVSPSCGPCHTLLHDIVGGEWQIDPLDPSIKKSIIISLGDVDLTKQMIDDTTVSSTDIPVFVDTEYNVTKTWGVRNTPTTIIIDNDQKIVRHVIGLEGERIPQPVHALSQS